MSQYFPKLYEPFGRDINVKVGLSNYATKADIKSNSHIDTSSFALKSNLAILKTEVDKLDIDKLQSLPTNLSNLKSKVDKLYLNKLAPVKNEKVKNDVVKKTEYNAKIKNIEDKRPDITNLATKTILNTKINKVKTEVPSISGLATTSTLTAVENKIPDASNLVKKTDYDTKVNEIEKKITDHSHEKYITTPEFKKLTAESFAARLASANLVTQTDFYAKLSSLNRKITSNKIKHLLVENQLKNLETFYSIYFRGKSHFEEDGTQNYLVLQQIQRYFKRIDGVGNGTYVYYWKSKRLSDEKINSIKTSEYGLTLYLDYYNTNKIRLKFNGGCLKQD